VFNLTHIQEHGTRQLPLWPVVGSSRCLHLASAPPWERLPLQILQALQVIQGSLVLERRDSPGGR
jgi:hypothetical protein